MLFDGDSVGAILDEEEEMVTDIVVGDQIVAHDLFDEYQFVDDDCQKLVLEGSHKVLLVV